MPVEAILRSAFQSESAWSAGHVVNKSNPIVSHEVALLASFGRCIAKSREVQSAGFDLEAIVVALPFFVLEGAVRSRAGRAVETDLHALAFFVTLRNRTLRHHALFVAATAFPLAHGGGRVRKRRVTRYVPDNRLDACVTLRGNTFSFK